MNKKIIIGIIVLGLIAGAVYIMLQNPVEEEETQKEGIQNEPAVSHFRDQLTIKVVKEVGQPIEGVNALVLMNVYPKFVVEDFEGVKTNEGIYTVENGELKFVRTRDDLITSAEKMIAEKSYGVLLENVSVRLGVEIVDYKSVNIVLTLLAGPQVGTDIMLMATFKTKLVYGTDQSLDQGALIAHCSKQGGTYNTCGTVCEPGAEFCVAVCAFTCENIPVQ